MRRAWIPLVVGLLCQLAPLPAQPQAPPLPCLEGGILGTPSPWADYAAAGATLAPHCYGTNHQTISGVQRVVFLGDSITVGTPPTFFADVYRNRLSDQLVSHFNLNAPSLPWQFYDPVDGTSGKEESGDFASCAHWGARADDLLAGDAQLADCFSANDFNQRTLVVMTIGGNDVVHLAEDAEGGASQAQLIADRDQFVQQIDDAIAWLKAPGRFPNGVFVVFANIYDPTDGTGVLPGLCNLSFGTLIPVEDLVIEAQEMLLQIAVARGVDMVFMREHFCGHGLNGSDPAATCYRGPGAETWIDLSCIHPSPDGHDAIADDFFATIIAEAVTIPVLPAPVRALLLVLLGALTLSARSRFSFVSGASAALRRQVSRPRRVCGSRPFRSSGWREDCPDRDPPGSC